MYTLLHGFYKYVVKKDEFCVLILGLDNAGKTVSLTLKNLVQIKITLFALYAIISSAYRRIWKPPRQSILGSIRQ